MGLHSIKSNRSINQSRHLGKCVDDRLLLNELLPIWKKKKNKKKMKLLSLVTDSLFLLNSGLHISYIIYTQQFYLDTIFFFFHKMKYSSKSINQVLGVEAKYRIILKKLSD